MEVACQSSRVWGRFLSSHALHRGRFRSVVGAGAALAWPEPALTPALLFQNAAAALLVSDRDEVAAAPVEMVIQAYCLLILLPT